MATDLDERGRAEFRLRHIAVRMQARVDGGAENVAIGQPLAKEIVEICNAAAAILNLIGGDGWKLVPVEPTEDMLKAPDDSGVGLYSREVFADIYRAMIAASPPPPVTP